jgi:hypothetical protein
MTWADYVDDVFRNAQPVCSHGNHTQVGGHDSQIFARAVLPYILYGYR